MIRIRHSEGEFEVSGSPFELRQVAAQLTSLSIVGGEINLDCDRSFDPTPYLSSLVTLRLIANNDLARVSASSTELTISGANRGLVSFASFFDIPDEAPEGFHYHHDYFPGDLFVAPDSLSLVVSVERTTINQ